MVRRSLLLLSAVPSPPELGSHGLNAGRRRVQRRRKDGCVLSKVHTHARPDIQRADRMQTGDHARPSLPGRDGLRGTGSGPSTEGQAGKRQAILAERVRLVSARGLAVLSCGFSENMPRAAMSVPVHPRGSCGRRASCVCAPDGKPASAGPSPFV